jgi:hypothetical protein
MTPLLIIAGIAALALLFCPAPRTQVIYVPVEIAEERVGLGCLPVILIGIVLIVAVVIIR